METQQTVLMILDGYGLGEKAEGNAIALAKTPNINRLMETCLFEEGRASGLDVGLPHGQMGNSEVGHLNIGAGRIVYQELTRISKSIEDGDFFRNSELLGAVGNCKKNKSSLHLFGLLSDGGVHSHLEHLFALLELAKQNGLTEVYVHCFMDGRDTAPNGGLGYLRSLEAKMKELGVGKVATVMGRYYAMDRDNRWERVQKAYNAMVLGEGEKAGSAEECIQLSYSGTVTDEFIVPTVITQGGSAVFTIKQDDSVIFFNFRPDRAREISRALCDPGFNQFERPCGFFDLTYVCFTEYDPTIPNKQVAFKPQTFSNTLGAYISQKGLKQLRLAETEKYAHVTFFFNGGVEEPGANEERILVPSPKVATYDLQPEMSAYTVKDELVKAIASKKYDLIIVNFANADMVGHTGVLQAAIKAVEVVDDCVGQAVDALLAADGQMLICADHGNSDKMVDDITKKPFTAHTTNPVPFIIVNQKAKTGLHLKKDGKLCDIAPTLLDMMGLPQPEEMSGQSLLIK